MGFGATHECQLSDKSGTEFGFAEKSHLRKCMNVIFGILNDNHAAKWHDALVCMRDDFPGLKFGKAVVFGNVSRKDEFNSKVHELQNNGFADCEFNGNFDVEWVQEDPASKATYLKAFRDVMSAEIAQNHSVFLTIASGNTGRREKILIISRLLGSRIFDRFNREYGPIKNDLYEIPHAQIDVAVAEFLNEQGRDDLAKKYLECVTNGEVTNDLIEFLANNDVRENQFLDYKSRFQKIDTAKERFKVFYELKNKVEQCLQETLEAKEFVLEPKYESRVKETTSLWKKLLKKEGEGSWIEDPFTRFTDLVGVRVIFSNNLDRDKGVEIIMTSAHFVNVDGSDEIKVDDRSVDLGYKAKHLDVKLNPIKYRSIWPKLVDIPFEIQMKSAIASTWSDIHHLLAYKENRGQPLSEDQRRALDLAFKKAAADLENADKKLAEICKEFDPRK